MGGAPGQVVLGCLRKQRLSQPWGADQYAALSVASASVPALSSLTDGLGGTGGCESHPMWLLSTEHR